MKLFVLMFCMIFWNNAKLHSRCKYTGETPIAARWTPKGVWRCPKCKWNHLRCSVGKRKQWQQCLAARKHEWQRRVTSRLQGTCSCRFLFVLNLVYMIFKWILDEQMRCQDLKSIQIRPKLKPGTLYKRPWKQNILSTSKQTLHRATNLRFAAPLGWFWYHCWSHGISKRVPNSTAFA